MNIPEFNTLAGAASILGFFYLCASLVWKGLRAYVEKREMAKQELKQELERLRAAGSNVAARTDLGFFVIMEVNSLRGMIEDLRHMQILFLSLTSILLLLCLLFGEGAGMVRSIVVACGLASFAMFLFFIGLATRLRQHVQTFEDEIKRVWAQAVDKRSPTS